MGYSRAGWVDFGEALAAVAACLHWSAVRGGFGQGACSGRIEEPSEPGRSDSGAVHGFRAHGSLPGGAPAVCGPGACESWLMAVVSGLTLLVLDRRAGHSTDQGAARYIERFSPNTITAVMVAVAGVTLVAKTGGGLYWLIPAALASLLGGVVNAWLFLVTVTG